MNFSNSKKQGDSALGAAISYFCSIGYTVSVPLTDSQDYDLLVDDGISICKIQVKSCCCLSGAGRFRVCLKICGGNSKTNYIHKVNSEVIYDRLFILCGNGDMYLMNKPDKRYSINLGVKYDRFRVSLGVTPFPLGDS